MIRFKAHQAVLCGMLAMLPAWSAAASPSDMAPQQLRVAVRDALEAQRAAGQAAERQEEAAAGRRLTPAERAQLRRQLRQEWAARLETEVEGGLMQAKPHAPSLDMTAGAATAGAASLSDPVALPRGATH